MCNCGANTEDVISQAWTPMYAEISDTIETKGNHEVKQLLVEQVYGKILVRAGRPARQTCAALQVVRDRSRLVSIVCGLMYGMLTKPQFASVVCPVSHSHSLSPIYAS
jgi:hypothetical protein